MAEPISTSIDGLIRENDALRARLAEVEHKLAEAQDVIRAIQAGDVDAVVVSGPAGDQVFTLKGAEYAYRALVEAMNEGAATLGTDGTVLYCNQRLADLLGVPLEQIIGGPAAQLVADEAKHLFETMLARALSGDAARAEIDLRASQDRRIPAYVSLREMKADEPTALCMVISDLSDRKQRDELIAAGRLATSILESAAEAIAVCDENGKIFSGNQALEDLCGFNPMFQHFDRALPLTIHPSEPGAPIRQFSISAALAGAVDRAQEVTLLRRDGQTVSLLLSAGRIVSPSGIAGCVLTMTDMTEHRRAEEALRAEQDFSTAVLETASALIIVVDREGRILRFNRACEAITGYTAAEVRDRSCWEFVAPEDVPGVRPVWDALWNEGFPNQYENNWVAKDGSRRLISWSNTALAGADGRVQYVIGTGIDITDRRKMEESLRRQAELMRLSFDAIIVWRLDGGIESWNRGAEELYGYSENEVLGRVTHELLRTAHPLPWPEIEARLRRFGQWEGELRHTTKDGRELTVSARKQLIVAADGVERILETNRDITERKRTQEALMRGEKLASVGRMASTIAHEINNPLETIGHAVYLALTDPGISGQGKSYLDLATQELERVTHITKQTLAFNREDKTPTLIDLRASIDSVVKLFIPRLKSRGITVEKRYAEVGCIRAGAGEIQQITSNLLSNSLDATPKHGRILFRVSRSIGKNWLPLVRFTMADTGSGIPPERLTKIFEPFFTTKEMVGTGLGLWVTKQIVEKYGATIRVRSKLGSGSVFSIAFPVAGDE